MSNRNTLNTDSRPSQYPGDSSFGERLISHEEGFVPIESMRPLVLAALSDRIDDQGYVKPVTIHNLLQYDAETGKRYARGRQTTQKVAGLLLPDETPSMVTDESGNEYRQRAHKYEEQSLIYKELTNGGSVIDLTSSDVSRLKHDEMELQNILETEGYTYVKSGAQARDAYHIKSEMMSQPEFSTLRVYSHSGANAMQVTSRVLNEAHVDRAKVWVPSMREGEQRFRSDTPVFEVSTRDDLQCVLTSLRGMYQRGEIDAAVVPGHSLGMKTDMPGVYLAQCEPGDSFNGATSRYFAGAIDQAVREYNLNTGQKVTEEWVDTVARRARTYAQMRAYEGGYDPTNHAFLRGEETAKLFAEVYGTA